MVYYLSIDGGGTKTEGVAVNNQGKIIKRLKVGSSNPNDIGTENAVNVIASLVEELIPTDATSVKIASFSPMLQPKTDTLLPFSIELIKDDRTLFLSKSFVSIFYIIIHRYLYFLHFHFSL